MIYDNQCDKIWIFGGRGGDANIKEMNDLWYYCLKNNSWHEAFPNMQLDEGNSLHSPVSAVKLSRMI